MNVLRIFLWLPLLTATVLSVVIFPPTIAQETQFRRLPVAEYRDKMKAGWIGQIAGVAWGAPTEFKWNDRIIPAADVPVWRP